MNTTYETGTSTRYHLRSGTDVVLTDDELEELMSENSYVQQINNKYERLRITLQETIEENNDLQNSCNVLSKDLNDNLNIVSNFEDKFRKIENIISGDENEKG